MSEGGTYFSLASLEPALLRLKRHLHVTTVASHGATCDGTMSLSAGVIGKLEKGGFANVVASTGEAGGEETAGVKSSSPL